jgi:tRNA threonylcarbamoyladenosine biosynthesis protein TsaE
MKKMISRSAEETRKLGESFAQNVKNGGVIALYGELGAGKTTFVQGLVKGLGIAKRIISPTFIIIRTYTRQNGHNFYHIDLYRINNEKEAVDTGLKDILAENGALAVIEWPDKIAHILPENKISVYFDYRSGNERLITFTE